MITYFRGDATNPQIPGGKMIIHICNDIGAWGKGFVMALSRRWPEPEKTYKTFYEVWKPPLGQIQLVPVEKDITVINMIAQKGIISKTNPKPLDLKALDFCLTSVSAHAREAKASIHMPRIGCGLAGGKWEEVEPLINKRLYGLNIFVYDLV